ncbi:hypothetical protein [Xylophilus sp. GOD-11R]|uniref:hypothetical protein n=1 Tax=Xylophilus sp. GOD-11R TaxID=3089814 RepID=UPI00298CC7C8|nr:hypothetical protein [Xylophilus sp. GOD-11R]WPB57564.1 hypothetical protein R9X41_02585 [Xylophilus sp. GOD-11R]
MAGLHGLPTPAFVPGMFGAPAAFGAGPYAAAGMQGPDFSQLKLGPAMHGTAHQQIYPVLGDDGRLSHLLTVDNRRSTRRPHSQRGAPATRHPDAPTVQHGTYQGRYASFWGITDNLRAIYHGLGSVAIIALGIAASLVGE